MGDLTSSPPPLRKASPHVNHSLNGRPLPTSPKSSTKRFNASNSSSSSTDRPRDLPTAKELMRLLAVEQDATRDLRHELSLVTSQLAFEQDRGDTAERKTKEAVIRFKDANDARVIAQADVARLTEELRLYKVALDSAQKEIFKAQDILREVEERRNEAEEEATRLRRKLRKMNEERMLEIAREEGRKQGLREGMVMGKDIGYLHGRNNGHFNGQTTADRPMERYFTTPDETEVRRSRGDLGEESEPPYTVTSTHFPPSNSASTSSSSSDGRGRPRSPNRDAPTASTRTSMYSPAKMLSEIPPDGWIPEADSSLLIRLPPPHELTRPPPTPGTRSPGLSNVSASPPLPPIPVPVHIQGSVRMVPEPRSPSLPGSEISAGRRPPRVRRRSSGDSMGSSTRTSELDLLNAPEHFTVRGNRSSGLSAIPEVASFQESLTPSNDSSRQSSEDRVDEAGFVHVSMPTPRVHAEAGSSKASRSPSQTLSVDQRDGSRPTSSSSFGTVNITIQPPSRPASNVSQSTTSGTRPHLLSPADADRPIPLPSYSEQTPTMVPLPPTGSTMSMTLPDGCLPPGFVPTGPPTPLTYAGSEGRMVGRNDPLPQSTAGSYHHCPPSHISYSGSTVAAPLPNGGSVKGDTPVVIPPPLGRFARREESDDSSSDAESLTTPPTRYHAASTTGHTAVGVALPPSGYTAAGITLPPSSIAGTPYSYARSPGVDTLYMNLNGNAGVTPAALGRTKSFSTDRGSSVRG
ncbi:hypothetical protein V8B97DRAFT_1930774 [Scleroderma yunnanense]